MSEIRQSEVTVGFASGFNFTPRRSFGSHPSASPLPRSRFQATIVRALWNHAILRHPNASEARLDMARDTATFRALAVG